MLPQLKFRNMALDPQKLASALDDLEKGVCANMLQAAKKHKLYYSTLNNHFRHGQLGVKEFYRNFQGALTEA